MRVTWDGDSRPYSEGISQGVLYPENSPGVAWNGLVSVTESGDANTPDSLYFDGQLYRVRFVSDAFAGNISAFTYPDEFEPYNGVISGITSQPRSTFGLCYKTNNELHLVYNALAAPSSDDYSSLSDSSDPISFSWDFTTLPEDVPMARPSSHLVILLDYANSDAVSDLETLLYGSDDNDPQLPSVSDVMSIFEAHVTLRITDNGDGTWTAEGPDDVVTMLDDITFQITADQVITVDSDTYRIFSQ